MTGQSLPTGSRSVAHNMPDNNPAERAMRGVALGRKNYLFVGSEAGGKAAAIAYTLIETAKLNGVDPNAWLADALARIPDYKITKVDQLPPWRSSR
jgi:transposase